MAGRGLEACLRQDLVHTPRAAEGEGGQGHTGLAARVASGFAPGTAKDGGHVLVHARMDIEAVGDLSTSFPDGTAQLCLVWCPVG